MSTSFAAGNAAQGHWCKCPNNHIYCITECGGPMEQASCPECRVLIGGENHRHVPGVTVATEMDGARNLMFTTKKRKKLRNPTIKCRTTVSATRSEKEKCGRTRGTWRGRSNASAVNNPVNRSRKDTSKPYHRRPRTVSCSFIVYGLRNTVVIPILLPTVPILCPVYGLRNTVVIPAPLYTPT